MPKVWNMKSLTCPEEAIYCGRGSPWGNPYRVGEKGRRRDDVCNLFRDRILPSLDVRSLKGKDLKCFCKPHRCHCDDILIKANCTLSECSYPVCPKTCEGRSGAIGSRF
jgi:hypothetical protein